MGGFGSGRFSYADRSTVEESLVLSVFSICQRKRDHGFWPDRSRWVLSDGRTVSVGYHIETGADGRPELMRLEYTASGEPVSYVVRFTSTACRYGGWRSWFICPNTHCERRCAKLYCPPGWRYFVCRTCAELTYQSTRESTPFRLLRRMEKIGRRLGWEEGFKDQGKPKGMHQRTYARLAAEYDRLEGLSFQVMVQHLPGIEGYL